MHIIKASKSMKMLKKINWFLNELIYIFINGTEWKDVSEDGYVFEDVCPIIVENVLQLNYDHEQSDICLIDRFKEVMVNSWSYR